MKAWILYQSEVLFCRSRIVGVVEECDAVVGGVMFSMAVEIMKWVWSMYTFYCLLCLKSRI